MGLICYFSRREKTAPPLTGMSLKIMLVHYNRESLQRKKGANSKCLSPIRESEWRTSTGSIFPLEETASRYCKSSWPCGFCRGGMHAQETDGETNKSSDCTEDHPPVLTLTLLLPTLSHPLTHPMSIISSSFLSSTLSLSLHTHTHTRSCSVLWRMGKHCQAALRGEKSVFLLHSGVFFVSSAWLLSWATHFNPSKDEEGLFVRKTQQRKRERGATGWQRTRGALAFSSRIGEG